MPEKAYPGTISSIILSVIVVMILLVPFAMANRMEKIRNGEAKYEFREVMCFDITKKSDFQGDDFSYIRQPFPSPEPNAGNGACYISYIYKKVPKEQAHSQVPVNIYNVHIPGTVNGYGVAQLQYVPGYPGVGYPEGTPFHVTFFTTLTKHDILDKEVTYIDVFFDIPSITSDRTVEVIKGYGEFGTYYRQEKKIRTIPGFILGEVNKMELTVDDLLEINNLDDDDILGFQFVFTLPSNVDPYPVPSGADIFFDMQIYCIEEFKILTIDWIAIAMVGGGIFMIFCSILMLPYVEFSGVIGRIVGKGTKERVERLERQVRKSS